MGLFYDEHLPPDPPQRQPLLLARAAEALRRLPADNPAWASDALLALSGALNEAALHLEVQHAYGAADGVRAVLKECRALESRARALAPVFAPVKGEPGA
jgi:hypothetical protein